MNRIALAPCGLAMMLALAACDKEPGVSLTNASPEAVAKAIDKEGVGTRMRAGQWELKVEVVDVQGPGISPEFAAEMKREGSKTQSQCITEADVAKPMSEILSAAPSAACRFDRYTVSGGKVDSEMTCPSPGGEINNRSSATYTSESLIAVIERKATTPAGIARSKMRIAGKRTGDCASGAKK